MQFDVLTLFPDMFSSYLGSSILRRAQEAGLINIDIHNIREYAADKHRVTDEAPFGGGGGMVLKAGPIFAATESIREQSRSSSLPVILLTPQGRPYTQAVASELASEHHLILLCGRYEGIDERVREHLVTDEISIGDYVLTGGELAAMIVIDSVARLIPGVLGAEGAAERDSFADGLLEGPHYTRPEVFRTWSVPDVLRSGHAAKIARWRREAALRRTWQRRPDLLNRAKLSEEDKLFLAALAEEESRKTNSESNE